MNTVFDKLRQSTIYLWDIMWCFYINVAWSNQANQPLTSFVYHFLWQDIWNVCSQLWNTEYVILIYAQLVVQWIAKCFPAVCTPCPTTSMVPYFPKALDNQGTLGRKQYRPGKSRSSINTCPVFRLDLLYTEQSVGNGFLVVTWMWGGLCFSPQMLTIKRRKTTFVRLLWGHWIDLDWIRKWCYGHVFRIVLSTSSSYLFLLYTLFLLRNGCISPSKGLVNTFVLALVASSHPSCWVPTPSFHTESHDTITYFSHTYLRSWWPYHVGRVCDIVVIAKMSSYLTKLGSQSITLFFFF